MALTQCLSVEHTQCLCVAHTQSCAGGRGGLRKVCGHWISHFFPHTPTQDRYPALQGDACNTFVRIYDTTVIKPSFGLEQSDGSPWIIQEATQQLYATKYRRQPAPQKPLHTHGMPHGPRGTRLGLLLRRTSRTGR